MKPLYTVADVEAATTGKLREMFTAITSKPTVDRNKVKLKARVLKLVLAQTAAAPVMPPVDRVEAKHGGSAEQITGIGKPTANGEHRDKVAEVAAQKASASRSKVEDRIMAKRQAVKPLNFGSKVGTAPAKKAKTGLAGMKAQKERKPVAKKVKAVKLKAVKVKEKSAAKKVKTPRSESETSVKLAALKPGQVLKHVFRQGIGESFTVECKVLAPPNVYGQGGKFKYDGRVFNDLREVIKACSGTTYNVLLFWGLKAWPKHKNRGPVAEAVA